MAQYSPWGAVQEVRKIATGIRQVFTASHGGILLSAGKNALVPEYMRNENGAYEEDCCWCIPALVFRNEFQAYVAATPWMVENGITPDKYFHDARNTLKNWYPDAYEKFFGVSLQPGESRERDKELFMKANENNLVCVSAFGDWAISVPAGMVGVVACIGSNQYGNDRVCRYFLVPAKDYAARSQFGFVVDPTMYEEVSKCFS